MGRKSKIAAVVLSISVLLGGCSLGKTDIVFTTGLSANEVFKIEHEKVSLAEAKVYLCNYQNLYGNVYGIDLWEQQYQTDDLEQYVKDVTLSEMTRVICMDQLAEQKEITLSKEEKTNLKLAAKEYYESLNEEEKSYMDVSEATIEKLYENYALASKVYTSLTTGVNEEVSDDEARVMEAQQIYVKDQNRAGEVASRLANGEDFRTVAADYNEAAQIDITFGRDEMPKEVEDIAFNLNDDEISESIATEDGYYFIKCINKFNQELTDANKDKIVKKREKEAFNDEYDAFVADLSSSLNEKAWDELELKTDGTITTNSFFEVLDKYYQLEE